MTTPAPTSPAGDHATLALGMTFCALFLGWAVDVMGGSYTPLALSLLTVAAAFCLASIALHFGSGPEIFLRARFDSILAGMALFSTLISAGILLYQFPGNSEFIYPLLFLISLCVLQVANLRGTRILLLIAIVLTFCFLSTMTFISPLYAKNPEIDVFLFQQSASDALHHGSNPYAMRFPNMYSAEHSTAFQDPQRFGPGTPFYGTGVVDEKGWVTYGFPYLPLSLLMVMPAYLLGGDCRFAMVIAMGLSAIMMATARPGRRGALAALLFLFNPQGFFVIDMSWTEPLLVFTFSLVMFCACRWRKGLPWALGLFFATKQYTVLALPLLFLLVEGPNPLKQFFKMVVKASLFAAAITLPFFAWNPHEFIRDVAQWQLVQPFRTDALSLLVWLYNNFGGYKAPIWVPFLAVVPAIVIGIRRCARSPAGFAAAVTLVCLTFFAFNKQAFCNYYYFVIAAALWSVAAMRGEPAGEIAVEASGIAAPV